MSEPRSIAITGATGFIGQHLCRHFQRLGWDVRALVRDPSRYPFAEPGIRLVQCELPDRIDGAGLSGVDVLIHGAYMTRFTDLESAERVNDAGTRHVLEVARAAGVGRFLFISSQSAHEEARSYYGKSKLALEQLFTRDDVVFRPGLLIGSGGHALFHRMCDTLKSAKVVPLFGGGHQPLQTIHIEDFCQATEAAITRRLSGTFTLAHPKTIEMGQFFRAIAERLGKKPLFLPFPLAPMLLALRVIELLRIPFPVSSENLLGLKYLRSTDTTADLEQLGVKLRDAGTALDDALGRTRP